MLPPGIFVLALVAACILLATKTSRGRRMRAALVLTISTAVCLYLGSISPVTDLIIRPLENKYPPLDMAAAASAAASAAAIVVLGGGIVTSSPEYEGRGSLRTDALKRAVYAVQLHNQLQLPVIVSGGSPLRGEGEAEAVVAARTLVSLGVPADSVLAEGKSRNTWENARFVSEEYGFKRVVLVTSAYHMGRSVKAFVDNALDPVPAPTDYKTSRSKYRLIDFFPDAGAMSDLGRALHEYLGMVYYAIRY